MSSRDHDRNEHTHPRGDRKGAQQQMQQSDKSQQQGDHPDSRNRGRRDHSQSNSSGPKS